MKKYKSFLKSIIFVMGIQCLFYFLIKNFIYNFNVMHSFLNIPFIKYFVYFYDIWYPFIFFVAFIIYKNDKEEYKSLIPTLLISAFMAHVTFLIYPTALVRPDITVNSFTDFVLYLTYIGDTPAVNCLPSVHCLFCFVFIYYVIRTKNLSIKYKLPIVFVFIMIVLSTLFIYQHIIEDAILSLIYTIIAIIIVKLFKQKLLKLLKFIF